VNARLALALAAQKCSAPRRLSAPLALPAPAPLALVQRLSARHPKSTIVVFAPSSHPSVCLDSVIAKHIYTKSNHLEIS